MALPVYLAMTAAELAQLEDVPPHIAWMACHFSSYGSGLSNFPQQLPQHSILILNDRIPIHGHDPDMVAQQLTDLAQSFSISGVLLDFQREEASVGPLLEATKAALPCPMAVTEKYARDMDCAVFLEAPRAYHPLKERTRVWEGRELWLEASFSPGTVSITKEGSLYRPETPFSDTLAIRKDKRLHCSYCIEESEHRVLYHFKRTADDLNALLEEAEALGITKAIGLYQELGYPLRRE